MVPTVALLGALGAMLLQTRTSSDSAYDGSRTRIAVGVKQWLACTWTSSECERDIYVQHGAG